MQYGSPTRIPKFKRESRNCRLRESLSNPKACEQFLAEIVTDAEQLLDLLRGRSAEDRKALDIDFTTGPGESLFSFASHQHTLGSASLSAAVLAGPKSNRV